MPLAVFRWVAPLRLWLRARREARWARFFAAAYAATDRWRVAAGSLAMVVLLLLSVLFHTAPPTQPAGPRHGPSHYTLKALDASWTDNNGDDGYCDFGVQCPPILTDEAPDFATALLVTVVVVPAQVTLSYSSTWSMVYSSTNGEDGGPSGLAIAVLEDYDSPTVGTIECTVAAGYSGGSVTGCPFSTQEFVGSSGEIDPSQVDGGYMKFYAAMPSDPDVAFTGGTTVGDELFVAFIVNDTGDGSACETGGSDPTSGCGYISSVVGASTTDPSNPGSNVIPLSVPPGPGTIDMEGGTAESVGTVLEAEGTVRAGDDAGLMGLFAFGNTAGNQLGTGGVPVLGGGGGCTGGTCGGGGGCTTETLEGECTGGGGTGGSCSFDWSDLIGGIISVLNPISDALCGLDALFIPDTATMTGLEDLFGIGASDAGSAGHDEATQWMGALVSTVATWPTELVTSVQDSVGSPDCVGAFTLAGQAVSLCAALSAGLALMPSGLWSAIQAVVGGGMALWFALALFSFLKRVIHVGR